MRTLLLTAMCLLTLSGSLFAHEFHTTFLTIDHNKKDKSLEFTLKMFAHDLEPTLEKLNGKYVDIGDAKLSNPLIFSYIKTHLTVSTGKERNLEFKWVGKELDAQVAYVYFEAPFDGDPESLYISNTLFVARFKEQVNYVSAKFGAKPTDLVLTKSKSSGALSPGKSS